MLTQFSRRRLILGCTAMAATRPVMAQSPEEISIGLASTSFATVAARLAKELGLFAQHGMAPRFIVLENASATTAALISRSVEYGVSGPGELVVAQSRGQPVQVLANTYRGLSGSLVLSKSAIAKSGISASAPVGLRLKALDGMTIAVPSAGGAYTVAFKGASKAAGANVRFTYMAQPAMVSALESGAIDGYVGGAPFWAIPVIKGYGLLWVGGPKGELAAEFVPASSSNLQVMRDLALARPSQINRIAKVFTDLNRVLEEHPTEVKSAVTRIYPDLDRPTLDLLYDAESPTWKCPPPSVEDMAHEIAFVRASGVALPNIDSLNPSAFIARSV